MCVVSVCRPLRRGARCRAAGDLRTPRPRGPLRQVSKGEGDAQQSCDSRTRNLRSRACPKHAAVLGPSSQVCGPSPSPRRFRSLPASTSAASARQSRESLLQDAAVLARLPSAAPAPDGRLRALASSDLAALPHRAPTVPPPQPATLSAASAAARLGHSRQRPGLAASRAYQARLLTLRTPTSSPARARDTITQHPIRGEAATGGC